MTSLKSINAVFGLNVLEKETSVGNMSSQAEYSNLLDYVLESLRSVSYIRFALTN